MACPFKLRNKLVTEKDAKLVLVFKAIYNLKQTAALSKIPSVLGTGTYTTVQCSHAVI